MYGGPTNAERVSGQRPKISSMLRRMEESKELVEDWVAEGKNLITGYSIPDLSRNRRWEIEERKYYIPPTPYTEK